MIRLIIVRNGKILLTEKGELPFDMALDILVLESYKFNDFQVVTEFTAETPPGWMWMAQSQIRSDLAELVGEALLCGA